MELYTVTKYYIVGFRNRSDPKNRNKMKIKNKLNGSSVFFVRVFIFNACFLCICLTCYFTLPTA